MAIPFFDNNNNERTPEEEHQLKLMLDLYVSLQNVIRSRHAQHTASRNHRVPRERPAGNRPAGNRPAESRPAQSGPASPQAAAPSNPPQQPPPVVIVLHPGNIENLSSMPDLVQSAMDQLPPPPSPHVTVSVPSSPMRDATFQFPECAANSGHGCGAQPPRPRPRRRFVSESSVMENSATGLTSTVEVSICRSSCCHLGKNETQSWTNAGTNLRSIAGDLDAIRTKGGEIGKSRLPVISPSLPNTPRNRNSSFSDNLLSLLIPTPFRETLWATMALYLGWRLVSRLR